MNSYSYQMLYFSFVYLFIIIMLSPFVFKLCSLYSLCTFIYLTLRAAVNKNAGILCSYSYHDCIIDHVNPSFTSVALLNNV